jgi:hypothetical protein
MLLDATVFGRFNVLFVNARPKTIPDGIWDAQKIVEDVGKKPQKRGEHWDDTYHEIIDVKGQGTH